MVDTPAIEAPAVEPPVAEPATIHFNNDGTFGDGWQGTLEEGLREEKSLMTFKNVNDLAKSFVNTKSMVGKNTIAVPTDASTELEWEEYHKAGGRPDTVADYNLTRPEELPEEYYNTELATAAQELFHKIGLSKKQADALFAFNNNNVMAQLTQKAQNDELAMTELKNGLYTEWGNAYEQRVHFGNMAVEQGTNDDADFKERLTQKFGNDPDFIRFSSNLGAKFIDHGSVDVSKSIPTPADYQTQIDEIQANPLYLSGTQEQRMKLAKQIMALREKMKPAAKIT